MHVKSCKDISDHVPITVQSDRAERWSEDVNNCIRIAVELESHGVKPDLKGNDITSTLMNVYPSGFGHLRDGIETTDFEWNSKSQHNALHGLRDRHMGPNVSFDDKTLKEFAAFADRYMDVFYNDYSDAVILSFDE